MNALDLLSRVRMEIRTPHGRLKFANPDLAANAARYRRWFGLPEDASLNGRVFTEFDRTHAVGPGESLEIALASRAEQTARLRS